MDYKAVVCPVCGASGNLSKIEERGETMWYCPHCAAKFSEKSSEKEYKKLESTIKGGLGSIVSDLLVRERTELYYNLRSNLWSKIRSKYIDSNAISQICADIKKLAPHDFLAEFFEIANNSDETQIAEYVQNIDVEENKLFIDLVLDFLIDSLKEAYITPVSFLIERAGSIFTPEKRQEYLTRFENEAKKVKDGIYESCLERDVFLAYSSKDMKDVVKILNFVESNGLTCFAAFRNIQHGRDAVSNYEKTLCEAIDNCKIFLFVSSKNSRNYSCDAFKKEIAYIKKKEMDRFPACRSYDQIPDKYKMLRIEYRLDNEPTPLVDQTLKSFFPGLTYAENFEQLIMRLGSCMEILNAPYDHSDAIIVRSDDTEQPKVAVAKKTYSSGRVYEGELRNDVPEGKGKMTYANGDIFDGEWKNGKANGIGKYTHANGDVFEGKYKDGVVNGVGRLAYANGDVFEGKYEGGVVNGIGKYTYANGDVFEETWKNGERVSSIQKKL